MRRNRLARFSLAVLLIMTMIIAVSNDVYAAFFSKNSTDYYKEGFQHFQKKNYYFAARSLEKALQLKSDYPEAQRILGFSYLKTGRVLDAEYIFTQQYKKESANVEIIQGLAWSAFTLGKHSESEKYFRNELKWAENHIGSSSYAWYTPDDKSFIESIYSDANFGLALLAKAQNNRDLVEKYFAAAVKYPNDFTSRTDILTAYGDFYYDKTKYPEALPIYEKAIREDKNNLAAQLKAAWCSYFNKDFSAGARSFDRALAISKKAESVEALYGLALCSYFQNKFEQAYRYLADAIAINPYYMDNAIVHDLIEKKPEWKTLWKDFGLAYASSNYAAAIYKLEGYIQKIKADDFTALMAEGWCYRGLGNWDKALEIFNVALKLKPQSEEPYIGLGFTYLSANKPAEALKAFNQALGINPQSPAAFNGLGYYYIAQKDETRALESVQKSVSLKSDFYDSQAFIANVLFKQKKYDQAVKEYEKLLKIDAAIVYYWNMLGWANYYAGKYDKALNAFAESRKINPFQVDVHYGTGLCLAKTGEMDEAKDALAAAINLHPSYAHTQDLLDLIKSNPKWNDLYKTLGGSYYNYQLYKLSAAAFRNSLVDKPDDIDALRGMAWCDYWLGQLDSSYAGFETVLKIKNDDVDALVGIGWVLYLRGKDSESQKYLEKAIEIDDKNVNAWRTIAAINYRARRFAEANNIYKKIAAIQPLAVDAYNNQGWSLYKENKYSEALARFNESLRIDKRMGEPYYGLALSYLKLGDINKAKENFAMGMYLYPAYMDGQELYALLDGNVKLRELYNSLGWGYYYKYQYDAAKLQFNKLLKTDAANRDALLGIGTVAYVLGNFQDAIDTYQKLLPGLAATSTAWDKYSYMLDNLGWSYYYQKKYDNALEAFQKLENYHPTTHYIASINGKGWCELMKGNKEKAQKLFQKSLETVPYNYSAEQGMKEIRK